MRQEQKDIIEERKKATFPVRQMTYLLDGGQQQTEKIEKIRKRVEAEPMFSKDKDYFLSTPEKYKRGLEKLKQFRELVHTGALKDLTPEELELYERFALQYYNINYHAMILHQHMFIPTIKGQADEEQLAKWLPLAENYDIVGCYAQTELGHGSNVRGLETTATFDPRTDEIVLNTPTLTATKWWPGALGKTATHAMVFAHLLLPKSVSLGTADKNKKPDEKIVYEDKGIHGFLVQIRCLDTHKNMPGVTSGLIGPKIGTNLNDNGYLILKNVRIPRRQMMMRYTKLDKDGKYHVANPNASKLGYGTMLFVRANIVMGAGESLSIATTIAIRYSSVRRQFPSENEQTEAPELVNLEQKVLDYQAQQYRLFPNLALSYALLATSRYMKNLYFRLQEDLNNNQFDLLGEAHAVSSGLKAVTTLLSSQGIEECRKACGGHGYLLNSGIGELFTFSVANNTLEGENYLIIQQLSRFLIKSFKEAQEAGKNLTGNFKYLGLAAQGGFQPISLSQPSDLLNSINQRAAFSNRAGYLVKQAVEQLDTLVAQGKSFGAAFQEIQWMAIRAAQAHCMLMIWVCFTDFINNEVAPNKQTRPLLPVLRSLCNLFALYYTEVDLGEFLEASIYTPKHCTWIHQQVAQLLKEIRPNAVALVDAFNHSDRDLNSALGRYDGNVYEALFDWTKLDPMNQQDVVECYEEVIRPILKKDFAKKTSKL